MNWGYRLLILYASFVIMILFLVFKASHTEFDLVSDKYYQEEIAYQQTIDARNSKIFTDRQMNFNISEGDLKFHWDFETAILADSCVLYVYCPQDAKMDKRFTVSQPGDQVFRYESMKTHHFQVKLSVFKNKKLIFYREN